jgi:hypothetical protein
LVVAGEGEDGRGSEVVMAEQVIEQRLQELLDDGCSASSAAKLLSKHLNLPKNQVYEIATRLKHSPTSNN